MRDAELDLVALSAYLDAHGVAPGGRLTAQFISGGRSNLTYLLSDGASDWVLRRPPHGRILAGAHDVSREYRFMAALAATDVPVPATVLLCQDETVLGAQFYIMDRIPGTVLRTRDQIAVVPEATRARLGATLVDTLADLHDVDYEQIGLADAGRPQGFLQRQLTRWSKQYEAIRFRDLEHVDRIAAALQARLPVSPSPSIVHGDYRIDNVIVAPDDPGRIAGVLDWELATIGDPLADLGMLVMFTDEPGRPFNPITAGLTAFTGFLSAAEVVERYVSRRGLQVEDIDWYLVFCEFKLAVILEQMHARFVEGETVGAGFEGIGAMVTVLLDSAMDKIALSRTL